MADENEQDPEQNTEQDTEAGADTAPTSTEQDSEPQPDEEAPDTGEESESMDWKAEADKWKALARKHEAHAKKADKAHSDELDQLREQATTQETAATEARHALASERLHTKLARAGVSEDDAAALIEHIDPARLTEDGQPSAKAIDAVAASLSRSASRGVDEDQGQTSESPTFSPDQWLRKKARR